MKNLKDFNELIKILEENRNAKISDSHWDKVAKMMKRNSEQFEAEEKALTPTWEDLHRPFTL